MVAHTYTVQFVHCVFGTKGRRASIHDPQRLWTYMRAIARNCDINVAAIGGTGDHVHLLIKLPPTICTADVIRTLKANSSRWMNEIGTGFAWQEGYASISVSPSQIPVLVRYIDRQAEHHRKRPFKSEYEALLRKSGVVFDPSELL
jgi:REP element-mobilizing transposase RayT